MRKVIKPKKSAAKDERELQLEYAFDYGVNLAQRVITLTGEIDEEMFVKIESALTQLESESKKTVVIKINSSGGSVYDALAIVGRITQSSCNIVTEGYGCIMSAATLILACGDKRHVSKYAWFMHHEASYDAEGKLSSHKALLIQQDREEKEWAKHMASFTGKEIDFWYKTGQQIDAYFTPEELLNLGIADEII